MGKRMTWPPPPREIFLIEKLARAVAVCGLEHEELILRSHYMVECLENEELILRRSHYMVECSTFKTYADYSTVLMVERSGLLKSPDHPYHDIYKKKRDAYIAQCRDGMICSRRPNFDDLKPPPNRDDPPPPPPLSRNPPPDITPIDLGLVKVTALFVARYGIQFWHGLIDMHVFPYFSFLKSTDKSFGYYNGLVGLYQRFLRPHRVLPDADEALGEFFRYLQLENLHDEKVIDLHALAYGLDCIEDDDAGDSFPYMRPSFSLMMLHPNQDEDHDIQPDAPHAEPDPIPVNRIFPVRISLKELGIIKLTALFVARYGECFLRVLMMREVTNPHFDFLFFRRFQRPHYPSMEPAEIRFNVFDLLVVEYSEIVTPSEMAKMANYIDYCSLVVFGVFHRCLQLKKLEEGVKTATIDLHAFVAGVDYLAHIHKPQYSALMSPPQRLSVMIKNQPTLQTHPGVLVLLPLRPKVSDYPPRFLCAEYRFPPRIEPDELAVIKLTAQFVTRYDTSFEEALEKIAARTTEFEFLKLDHGSNGLFLSFVELYCTMLKPSTKVEKSGDHVAKALEFFFDCLQLNKLKKNGVDSTTTTTSVMELSCFLSGVDYFAWMDVAPYSAIYSAILTAPERRSLMMNRLKRMYTGSGGGLNQPPTLRTPLSFSSTGGYVSHNEIGIIKLTALFVARYGLHICREVMKKLEEMMKKVGTIPRLNFMEPGDAMFDCYEKAVDAYSKVVKDSDHVDTETVIERYCECLQWEEEKKGSMTFVDDLYGFVEGVDCFAQMEDEYFREIMGNHLLDSPYNQHDEDSSSSESEPKRRKVDESACVIEDSSTIKVSVPTVDGRKVIEIAVESLSEKVWSLKEKIANVIQMPAKDLKLRGKEGVLKGDKSLAQNDVETGEILTLTWRISRWD